MKAGQHLRLMQKIKELLHEAFKKVDSVRVILALNTTNAHSIKLMCDFYRLLGAIDSAIFLLNCEAIPTTEAKDVKIFLEKSQEKLKFLENI